MNCWEALTSKVEGNPVPSLDIAIVLGISYVLDISYMQGVPYGK